jgi:hypothetical protein
MSTHNTIVTTQKTEILKLIYVLETNEAVVARSTLDLLVASSVFDRNDNLPSIM